MNHCLTKANALDMMSPGAILLHRSWQLCCSQQAMLTTTEVVNNHLVTRGFAVVVGIKAPPAGLTQLVFAGSCDIDCKGTIGVERGAAGSTNHPSAFGRHALCAGGKGPEMIQVKYKKITNICFIIQTFRHRPKCTDAQMHRLTLAWDAPKVGFVDSAIGTTRTCLN